MGQTPNLSLPYPELGDSADVPADMKELADRLDLLLPDRVTSLPGTPVDGQEIFYVADAANGVIWHLRYNAAGSGYRWEFVGGAPKRSTVNTDETFTKSLTYVDAATVGPQITLPLAGDYAYSYSVNLYVSSQTTPASVAAGLSLAGAQPAAPDIASTALPSGLSGSIGRNGTLVAQPSGRVVKLMQNVGVGAGGTPHTRFRELQITPVRVG